MEIQLSNDTRNIIRRLAQSYDFDTSEVIEKAIAYYSEYIEARAELKEEFSAWDSLSDEAIEKFEARL